jgi:hypothetical protein
MPSLRSANSLKRYYVVDCKRKIQIIAAPRRLPLTKMKQTAVHGDKAALYRRVLP